MDDESYFLENEVMEFFKFLRWVLLFIVIWALIAFIVKRFDLPRGASLFTTAILFWGGYTMFFKDAENEEGGGGY